MCSKGQPCDITGIEDYLHLDRRGGIQRPFPKENESADDARRLFTDGKFYHADNKAKLVFVCVQALLTPTIQPGQLFMPMHYEETNLLTKADFDPHSHQPSYKACAVACSLYLSDSTS
jgi:predicted molibdopterin-dependent oxidoreductase YjgC